MFSTPNRRGAHRRIMSVLVAAALAASAAACSSNAGAPGDGASGIGSSVQRNEPGGEPDASAEPTDDAEPVDAGPAGAGSVDAGPVDAGPAGDRCDVMTTLRLQWQVQWNLVNNGVHPMTAGTVRGLFGEIEPLTGELPAETREALEVMRTAATDAIGTDKAGARAISNQDDVEAAFDAFRKAAIQACA